MLSEKQIKQIQNDNTHIFEHFIQRNQANPNKGRRLCTSWFRVMLWRKKEGDKIRAEKDRLFFANMDRFNQEQAARHKTIKAVD